MTPATLAALQRFEAARDTLAELFPETAPADDRDRRTTLHADAPAWDAIDDALDFLYAIDPGGQASTDEPAALVHWRTQAWRAVVVAAYEAAGQGLADDELSRLDRMTNGELADELTYLSDYQN